ncbi:MAG: response regulator [Bacteroidota bacterium]
MELGRILLVDDDVEEYLILNEAFTRLGAGDVLEYAEGGRQALELLNRQFAENGNIPELIVLDINMPALDGPATLALIRADMRFKNIPVVVYSTSINPNDLEKCKDLGPCSSILKPSSMDEIISVGEALLALCGTPV